MSKGLISALLHTFCDAISLQIFEMNISIEGSCNSISFWKKSLCLVVAVYGGHIDHRLKSD